MIFCSLCSISSLTHSHFTHLVHSPLFFFTAFFPLTFSASVLGSVSPPGLGFASSQAFDLPYSSLILAYNQNSNPIKFGGVGRGDAVLRSREIRGPLFWSQKVPMIWFKTGLVSRLPSPCPQHYQLEEMLS